MEDATTNPRAVIGDNQPPLPRQISAEENFGAVVAAFLADEYAAIVNTADELLVSARALPEGVTDEADVAAYADLIKRLRDTAKRAEAFRAKEKEPYLRGSDAVDGFFFTLIDRLARRSSMRHAKPGAADVLHARLDAYQQRKLAEEAERRRVAAEEEARIAREAKAEADRAAAAAEAARLAADRARKPETIAEKEAVAEAAEQQASSAKIDAEIAVDRAQAAHVATLAKPADMARTRVDGGPVVTMARENYAIITDAAALDKETLWPFITLDAKEKALRAWAKTTGYAQPMAGAAVGSKPRTAVR